MDVSIYDWLSVLRDWGGIAAVPFLLAGLGLMLFGWRLWRLCVMLSFAGIGAALGTQLVDFVEPPILSICAGAVVLGGLAFWFAPVAIGALGGLIGSGMIFLILVKLKLDGPVLWIGGSLGFLSASALAAINRRYLVVLVTSFLGAVAFVSGLTSLLMAMPVLYGTFRSMASYSIVVVPFVLLVPTVMSCFYQISEIHRIREDL